MVYYPGERILQKYLLFVQANRRTLRRTHGGFVYPLLIFCTTNEKTAICYAGRIMNNSIKSFFFLSFSMDLFSFVVIQGAWPLPRFPSPSLWLLPPGRNQKSLEKFSTLLKSLRNRNMLHTKEMIIALREIKSQTFTKLTFQLN